MNRLENLHKIEKKNEIWFVYNDKQWSYKLLLYKKNSFKFEF